MADLQSFLLFVLYADEFEQRQRVEKYEKGHFVITKFPKQNCAAENLMASLQSFCLQTRFSFHGNGITWISLHNLGHTNSQSEMAKVGAVNGASANRHLQTWRSKVHGKKGTWLMVV